MRFSLTTFLLQIANFLVLVWVLRRFLFRPVQRIVDQRRRQIEEAVQEAERRRAALADVDGEIGRRQADAAAALERKAADERRQMAGERQQVLDGARLQAEGIVAAGRTQLGREREEALAGLEGRAAQLAAEMAGRLVRAAGAEAVTTALLEQALHELRGQRAAARERFLGGAAAAVGAPIRVVTAVPLSEEARGRCRAELARALGGEPQEVAFADDRTLLAGVEIHFPHTVLRHSWREHLAAASRSAVRGAAAPPEPRDGEPADLA